MVGPETLTLFSDVSIGKLGDSVSTSEAFIKLGTGVVNWKRKAIVFWVGIDKRVFESVDSSDVVEAGLGNRFQ